MKETEVQLGDSDTFSLLPDEFEFEIRVENSNSDALTGELRVKNVREINQNFETGMSTSRPQHIVGSELEHLDAKLSAPNNVNHGDHDRTPSPDLLQPTALFQHKEMPTNEQENAGTSMLTGRKRSFEMSDGDSRKETSKKPRSMSPAIPMIVQHLNSMITNAASLNPSISIQPELHTAAAMETIKTDPESTETDQNQEIIRNNSPSSTAVKPDPDANSTTVVKTNQNHVPNRSNAPSSTAVKPDADGTTVVKKETASPLPVMQPQQRSSCTYGIRCYRLTQDHRNAEAHPGDNDYRRPVYPPAPSVAPHCQYGVACYRRNPDHFREFQHPPASEYSQ